MTQKKIAKKGQFREVLVGKCEFGKMPVGEVPVWEVPVWEMLVGGSASWGKWQLGEVAVGELPVWESVNLGKCQLGNSSKNLTLGWKIFRPTGTSPIAGTPLKTPYLIDPKFSN